MHPSAQQRLKKTPSFSSFKPPNLQLARSFTCIKRAGADLILTYFAKDVALMLQGT
ncbi:MAG: hypothetical protein RH949_17230 [Coleofasciculus sp. A1-SPW-01]